MTRAAQVATVEPGVAAVVHKLWHSLREVLFRLVEQRESSAQLHTHAMTMARRTLDTLESARCGLGDAPHACGTPWDQC